MFARIFRGGCRGREPAVIKKVNAFIFRQNSRENCRLICLVFRKKEVLFTALIIYSKHFQPVKRFSKRFSMSKFKFFTFILGLELKLWKKWI